MVPSLSRNLVRFDFLLVEIGDVDIEEGVLGQPFFMRRRATLAAKRAAGRKSKWLRAANETANDGIPNRVPSNAAETVPE